jgi:hypothetical protein
MARAHDRRHELTIRRALGASSTRLGAELLTEAAMLAATAGAIGLWFAARAVAWLAAVTESGYGFRSDALALDWRAALFTAAACALVTVVFTSCRFTRWRSRRVQKTRFAREDAPSHSGARAFAGRSWRCKLPSPSSSRLAQGWGCAPWFGSRTCSLAMRPMAPCSAASRWTYTVTARLERPASSSRPQKTFGVSLASRR